MSAPPAAREAVRRTGRPAVVVALSAAVPGRARLRVHGLRGRHALAARLEDGLGAHPAIREVHASAVTGNVLVLFDAARLPLGDLLVETRGVTERARSGATRVAAAGPDGWHARDVIDVMRQLETSADGLTSREAIHRLATVGPNRLPVPRPRSATQILGAQLASMPVVILAGAAALSIASGAVVEAVVIGAVVAANAAVGYFTESRVERILTSLQQAGIPEAIVYRDGGEVSLPATALVPGDVVVLRSGMDVPADARLFYVDGLAVDESALTGESVPVVKRSPPVGDHRTPLAERASMVYAGTVTAEGSALAVVTGTGRASELGRVRALVGEAVAPPTPLERQLDRTGRSLVLASLACCVGALGLGVLRGVGLMDMVRTTVSLAVAAVPEGLPGVATTTLALGVQRMVQRRTVVRRLGAIEGLGATTLICADKTGTLTENRMTVATWWVGDRRSRPAGQRSVDPRLRRAAAIAVLCNEARLDERGQPAGGSATELALLIAARRLGVDWQVLRTEFPLLRVQPRIDGAHWMATVHDEGPGQRLVAVKGAPEQVLARAKYITEGGRDPRLLTEEDRRAIIRTNARLAGRGLRVLGLAYKDVEPEWELSYEGLVWVGLVGLTDPVRTGVRETIAACRAAGIRSVILTGDQAATAAAVCRDLGLVADGRVRVLEATELARMDERELREAVRHVDVFARVSPAHKYQIVRALQAGGHIVAMTGDGINDAAALKAADVGVAMGAAGTDVARDVADVVLLDDDFGAVVGAIEQGRTIQDNIGKALRFLLGSNFSEILVTLGGLALALGRPLSPIQFLWLNLVSDVLPALTLALEPPEANTMRRPPRDPAVPLLPGRILARLAGDAALMSAGTLGAYAAAAARTGAGAHASTVAFSTLTSAQLLYALASRSEQRSGFSALGRNPLLASVVGGSLALQLLAVALPPLRGLLGTTTLGAADWALVAAGATLPMAVREALRAGTRNS
jgi:Ca2+-transporting ATPase